MSIRWCPSLAAPIVTHLVTHVLGWAARSDRLCVINLGMRATTQAWLCLPQVSVHLRCATTDRESRACLTRRACNWHDLLISDLLGLSSLGSRLPSGVVLAVGVPAAGQYVRVTHVQVLAGRYRLVTLLGSGGFSEVWRGEDTALGRMVAVKLLTSPADQSDLLARFDREARTLAGLRHPNVVAVFDAGADQGVPYVVMELLAGPGLDGLLAMRGRLPVDLALDYAGQAASGLAAAHAAGVVHRDIKPANLVLDGDGTLKVVDFGIARQASASAVTAAGVTFATPAYLSPEQAAGRPAEPRSDLYSLGCVLYEMLAGQPPFSGDHPMATVHQHLNAPVPAVREHRPDVPPVVDQLLAALLAKNPEDRPPDAATVQAWLARVRPAAGPGTPGMTMQLQVGGPEGPVPHGRPTSRRRWPLAVAGGVVIAALLAGLALTHAGGSHPPKAGASASSKAVSSQPASTPRAPHLGRHHLKPGTPAGAVQAVRDSIASAENSGAIQAQGATDLLAQLTDISQFISEGKLSDADQKVGDFLQHVDDVTHNGWISSRGLTLIKPSIRELVRSFPQQS